MMLYKVRCQIIKSSVDVVSMVTLLPPVDL